MAQYRRRQPETTVLHQVVHDHLETLLAQASERYEYGYPAHIEKTFRGYLACGDLRSGFARVRCQTCRKEILVGFSCKLRGLCPSCEGRRMADVAAHLVDRVLPRARYRQWTLSVPYDVRLPMAADSRVLSDVLRRFVQEVFRFKRRQARRQGIADPQPAAVTFVQRFGSVLNVHPHFHSVVPDGVFTRTASGAVRWVALDGPTGAEIEQLATRIALRLARYLQAERFDHEGGAAEAHETDRQGELASLAEGLRRPGLAGPRRFGERPTRPDAAWVDGVSLHVGRPIEPNDRAGLERMLRYGLRPAFAQSRLSLTASGKVSYQLKRPWYTGQTHVTLEPVEFLRRLALLVPPPRSHLTRFHGAFAPRSAIRSAVVALVPNTADPTAPTLAHRAGHRDPEGDNDGSDAPAAPRPAVGKRARMRWAALFARVFALDLTRCTDPACRGPAKVIAWITEPDVIDKILDATGHRSAAAATGGRTAPARAPPQLEFPVHPPSP